MTSSVSPCSSTLFVENSTICAYCPENLSEIFGVYAADSDALEAAKLFATKLKVSFQSCETVKDPSQLNLDYVFVIQGLHASIVQTGKGAPGPVSASFLQGKTTHRLHFGGGKGQMIAKAVGLNKGVTPTVLDATAGLGQDAFVLASLGCSVMMLERSPIIAGLLDWALQEAQASELSDIVSRLLLIQTDAVDWLTTNQDKVADVIYLDPMYPHSDKSALVKKEMKLFHSLVGEPAGDAELLDAALNKARYRVVVKRPRKGVCIEGRPPAHQIVGKSCRYDIYPIQRLENLK